MYDEVHYVFLKIYIKKFKIYILLRPPFNKQERFLLKTSLPWGQKKNCQTDFLKIYTSATEYSDF